MQKTGSILFQWVQDKFCKICFEVLGEEHFLNISNIKTTKLITLIFSIVIVFMKFSSYLAWGHIPLKQKRQNLKTHKKQSKLGLEKPNNAANTKRRHCDALFLIHYFHLGIACLYESFVHIILPCLLIMLLFRTFDSIS